MRNSIFTYVGPVFNVEVRHKKLQKHDQCDRHRKSNPPRFSAKLFVVNRPCYFNFLAFLFFVFSKTEECTEKKVILHTTILFVFVGNS